NFRNATLSHYSEVLSMRRIGATPLLLVWFASTAVAGDTPSGERDVAALQARVQKAIEKAEPGVACVLVSRSQEYRHFGAAAADPAAGKLGGFKAPPAQRGFMNVEDRQRSLIQS